MQNTIRFIRRKHCDTSYEVIETAFYMYTDQNEDQSKGEKERRNEKRPKTKLPQPLRARARERERDSRVYTENYFCQCDPFCCSMCLQQLMIRTKQSYQIDEMPACQLENF